MLILGVAPAIMISKRAATTVEYKKLYSLIGPVDIQTQTQTEQRVKLKVFFKKDFIDKKIEVFVSYTNKKTI